MTKYCIGWSFSFSIYFPCYVCFKIHFISLNIWNHFVLGLHSHFYVIPCIVLLLENKMKILVVSKNSLFCRSLVIVDQVIFFFRIIFYNFNWKQPWIKQFHRVYVILYINSSSMECYVILYRNIYFILRQGFI